MVANERPSETVGRPNLHLGDVKWLAVKIDFSRVFPALTTTHCNRPQGDSRKSSLVSQNSVVAARRSSKTSARAECNRNSGEGSGSGGEI